MSSNIEQLRRLVKEITSRMKKMAKNEDVDEFIGLIATLRSILAEMEAQQARIDKLEAVAKKLANIADAYDSNDLDDEARKFWGLNDEHENKIDPKHIGIYQGRGGRELLTLADCIDARTALEGGQK